MACDGRVGVGSYKALVSWYEVRCVGGKVLCQGACVYLCVCNDFCEDSNANDNDDRDYDNGIKKQLQ